MQSIYSSRAPEVSSSFASLSLSYLAAVLEFPVVFFDGLAISVSESPPICCRRSCFLGSLKDSLVHGATRRDLPYQQIYAPQRKKKKNESDYETRTRHDWLRVLLLSLLVLTRKSWMSPGIRSLPISNVHPAPTKLHQRQLSVLPLPPLELVWHPDQNTQLHLLPSHQVQQLRVGNNWY